MWRSIELVVFGFEIFEIGRAVANLHQFQVYGGHLGFKCKFDKFPLLGFMGIFHHKLVVPQ